MMRQTSVQTAHVKVDDVEDDLVRLENGHWRALLHVSSINFKLKGDIDKESVVGGYAGFLNSLSFPLQVVIRVLPLDTERYLGTLEQRIRHELPERLLRLAQDYAGHVRRMARNSSLLDRQYLVVVPAEDAEGKSSAGWLFPWRSWRRASGLDSATARKKLAFRCEEIERQLNRCGLIVRRLRGAELAQLYFACWCPEQANDQRFRRELAEYTALVVRGAEREVLACAS